MRSPALRTLLPLAMLAAGSIGRAAVDYTFVTDDGSRAFSLTTDTFISTRSTFESGQLNSFTGVQTVDFFFPTEPLPYTRISVRPDPSFFQFFFFPEGSFSTYGVYSTEGGARPAILTVSRSPVPEPATLAALGLGALALIKRRRPAPRPPV